MTPPTVDPRPRAPHRSAARHRPRGRALLAVGFAVAGLAAASPPSVAAAQSVDRIVDRIVERVPGPAADQVAGPETDLAYDPAVEVLELRCGVRQGDDVAAVHCRWSSPTSDAAAGLRLWRIAVGSDEGRQVVFRTDDVTVNSYTDVPVRPGRRYVYVVQAVSPAGRTVALSRGAYVAVPPLPDVRPDVEILRLECRPADDFHVGCTWTLPTVPGARTLTLWRSIDGGARVRVLSSHHPFPTTYRDTVPDGTRRAVYAVIATDGGGNVVARSRAESVAFRDTRPVDTRPVDTRPVDTRPVDTRPVDTRPVDTRPPRPTTTTTEPPSDPVTAVPTDRRGSTD